MKSEFDIKRAVGGGGSAPILLRLDRWLFLAAKQLGSEAAKRDLGVKTKRCEDAKNHSLLRLKKFDLFRKIVDILSLVKRNILISPLEGEKKFLSELCELRNFREGYKKYKNSDRATECAMTDVGEKKGKIKMNKNNLQQKQPNNPAAFPETNYSQFTTHHSPKRKFAFTLAEVLITLGIIGVVAALTLPTLINKYKIKSDITRLKAIYSTLSQAIKNSEAENGFISEWNFVSITPKEISGKYLLPYLKVVKTCDDGTNCFAPKYTYPNGNTVPSFKNYYSFILADGSIVGVKKPGAFNRESSIAIIVDVNGTKAPNKSGYDLFFFNINTQNAGCWEQDTNLPPGFYPSRAGCSIDINRYASGPSCNTFYSGEACAALLMSVGWDPKKAQNKGYKYGLY